MLTKTTLFALLSLMLISLSLPAQSCLPDGITFTTQGQIDSFSINYPGCTAIEGDVAILSADDASNVDGLSNLTSIGGNLRIISNSPLKNVDGLSNLMSIGGSLTFAYNTSLTNIDGFSGLTSIGGSLTVYCNAMENIDGLSNLTTIGGSLFFSSNSQLPNIDGFSGLTSIGGSLSISDNQSLTNIAGLSGLTLVGGDLGIYSNFELTDCCGIQDLLASSGVGGTISIHNNPSECSSESEILAADCAIGTLSQKVNTSSLLLSPNPAGDILQISLEGVPANQQAHLLIVNPLGQTVLDRPRFRLGEAINIRHLPKGLFTVRIKTESNIFVSRLVKN